MKIYKRDKAQTWWNEIGVAGLQAEAGGDTLSFLGCEAPARRTRAGGKRHALGQHVKEFGMARWEAVLIRRRGGAMAFMSVAMGLSFAMVGCEPATPCLNSDESGCAAGMFCRVADGTCDQTEVAGVCTPRPEVCNLAFSPVCGCDGVTYSNRCMADSAGVNLARTGSCENQRCCDPNAEPGFQDNPTCVEGATCCSDGTWRCNEGDGSTTCASVGSVCSEVCGGIAGIACSREASYCRVGVGECCCDIQGVCVPRPDACIEIFAPVCGCDGTTFSNDCSAAAAGISVDHDGECDPLTDG